MLYVMGIIACSVCIFLELIVQAGNRDRTRKDLLRSVLYIACYVVAILCQAMQLI